MLSHKVIKKVPSNIKNMLNNVLCAVFDIKHSHQTHSHPGIRVMNIIQDPHALVSGQWQSALWSWGQGPTSFSHNARNHAPPSPQGPVILTFF